ncbi:MAG: hypothetical protein HUJ69_01015 [Lachnospiraceae bacterium]|nr:hypothetical protein [Lachnospiraceae bacterium]
MKRKWWISLSVFLIVALFSLLLTSFPGKKPESSGQDTVLIVNGEEVSIKEAMIYYRLMQKRFVEAGGENVWSLDFLGFDVQQQAIDNVMESIIRIKLVQPLAGSLKRNDFAEIEKRSLQLAELLGSDYMEAFEIDDDLITRVVTENYLAFVYERNADFRSSDFEEEIRLGLEEAYGVYDTLDRETYLSSTSVVTIMFYTGQYTDGVWIEYPQVQREQILENAELILSGTDPSNFYRIAKIYADSCTLTDNPVFNEGAILHERTAAGTCYFGQVSPEAAGIIWQTEPGAMTKLIETEYGYLAALVTSRTDCREVDLRIYEEQLQQRRAAYRVDLIQQLKDQRLEEEWQRLEQESSIQRFTDVFSSFVEANENLLLY